jgi:hypothetical protein
MKVIPIFKKYMVPFLKENGFEVAKTDSSGVVIFQHEENSDAKIYFQIESPDKGRGICPDLVRDNKGFLMSYPLCMFLDEPSEMDTAYRDGFWRFNTEVELIGALEEQADLLKNKAFEWLFQRWDVDIDAIIKQKAVERENAYNSADDFGKELLVNKVRVKRDEWKARRVKPVHWK